MTLRLPSNVRFPPIADAAPFQAQLGERGGELPLQVQTLSGTSRSQLGPLAIFLLLVARLLWRTGLRADHSLNAEGYIEAILAALVLAVACLNLLRPPTLILDEGGFTWRSWRKSGTFPWASIESFFVGPSILGGKPKIAFNFLQGQIPTQVAATEMNRSMNGFDRSMANVWNMSSEELVDLLNGYVSRSRTAQS